MRPCLDSGKWTKVTKKWSLPLRCLEREVEETDVFTLGNVLPSAKEVELWRGPTSLRVSCLCLSCAGLLSPAAS